MCIRDLHPAVRTGLPLRLQFLPAVSAEDFRLRYAPHRRLKHIQRVNAKRRVQTLFVIQFLGKPLFYRSAAFGQGLFQF
ncbi:MAG: hypothetical protein LBB83_07670, partial [Treponema sp.]|nr:hypothetical protein [Treponema sp.]